MSKDMQLQLDGIKTEMSGLRQGQIALERRMGGVENRLDGVENRLDRVEIRLGGVEGRLDRVESRLGSVEQTLHKVVVTVSGHTEHLIRIDEKLKKLDLLDRIAQSMDALAGDLKSSRAERALSDLSFREQQATLSDHEVRIHRLERNTKPS